MQKATQLRKMSAPEQLFIPNNAEPTRAAGAASTPNTNCGDVENNANKSIGNTEPYNPYTAGRPAICAYPIEIGIDTAIMINPVITSCTKFSLLYFRIVGAKVIFASFILCHSLLSFLLHTLDK